MSKNNKHEKTDYTMSEDTKHEGVEIILITKQRGESKKYKNSEQAYRIFRDILNYEEYELRDKEHFWVMGIDTAGYIVCIYIVALGSGNQVNMTAAEIFDIAIGLKSRKIVLAHNHPSGNVEPSKNDIFTTNMLYHVSLPFGIEILDHLIIGLNKYSSFVKTGVMGKIKEDAKFKSYLEGQDEGLEEGQKIGMAKGKVEGRKENRIETAKEMLSMNYDIKDIIKITKLTKKAIIEIKDSLNLP